MRDMNKQTQEYFEANPHLYQALVKSAQEKYGIPSGTKCYMCREREAVGKFLDQPFCIYCVESIQID